MRDDCCRSDPTENDSVEGLRPNARGPGLVTFGVSWRCGVGGRGGLHLWKAVMGSGAWSGDDRCGMGKSVTGCDGSER